MLAVIFPVALMFASFVTVKLPISALFVSSFVKLPDTVAVSVLNKPFVTIFASFLTVKLFIVILFAERLFRLFIVTSFAVKSFVTVMSAVPFTVKFL